MCKCVSVSRILLVNRTERMEINERRGRDGVQKIRKESWVCSFVGTALELTEPK